MEVHNQPDVSYFVIKEPLRTIGNLSTPGLLHVYWLTPRRACAAVTNVNDVFSAPAGRWFSGGKQHLQMHPVAPLFRQVDVPRQKMFVGRTACGNIV